MQFEPFSPKQKTPFSNYLVAYSQALQDGKEAVIFAA
jgi:hypothetical protein